MTRVNINEYWLYVEPFCFIMTDSNNAIVYNSLSSSKIVVKRSGKLGKIIEELEIPENMYCVRIDENDLKDCQINEFINNLKIFFSGDLIECSYCRKKPLIMFPELKIQRQIKTLEELSGLSAGTDILTYLNEVFIYINGNCDINCKYCDQIFKQTFFCKQQNKELNYDKLNNFLTHLNGTAVNCINITGGDVFNFSKFFELIPLLKSLQSQISYHIHYKNAYQHLNNLVIIKDEKSNIIIKVDFPIEQEKMRHVSNTLDSEQIKHTWNFIISSDQDYSEYEKLVSTFNLENTEIVPFFDNYNYEFFAKNVFLNLEDINMIKLNRRELFSKKILNIIDFGKIIITCDGNVYSNINHNPLGRIDQSLYELIFAELKSEESWFNIRQSKPCSDCIYQYLCPSPSNYELVIGKSNLCNVKP